MLMTSRGRPLAWLFTLLGVITVAATAHAQSWRSAGDDWLRTPAGVAVHGSSIYVADFDNHRIAVFANDGTRVAEWGTRGSQPGQFNGPSGVAIDAQGRVYVSDFYNHRVQVFTSDGRFLRVWGSQGRAAGAFRGPIGIAVDRNGTVFVTDLDNHRVQRFTADGDWLGMWGERGREPGQLIDPWGIAIGSDGQVHVADHGNHRVQRFAASGEVLGTTNVAAPDEPVLAGPVALAVDDDGAVYVSDLVPDRVLRFDADGRAGGVLNLGAASGEPGMCYGLALAGGALVSTDASRHRLVRVLLSDVEPLEARSLPIRFALTRAWPNPSHGATSLRFALPSAGRMRVEIFSVDGRRVRDFGATAYGAGEHVVRWNGVTDSARPAEPGLYFVRGRFDDGRREVSVRGRIVLLQ